MSTFQRSRPFAIFVLLSLVLGAGWGSWVYYQTRPEQPVSRSALRNHTISRAENGEEVPPPKHTPSTGKHVLWKDLTPDLQKVLGPLEKRWDYLSSNQRRTLLTSANRYTSMTEEQQIRFTSRLADWTKLTGKERRELRERYKALKALSPEQQEQFRRSWFEEINRPDAGEDPLPNGLRAL